MRTDLELPVPVDKPLVGGVEALDGTKAKPGSEQDRDEAILTLLRERLRDRKPNTPAPKGRRSTDKKPDGQEDKYEPQRIGRKICWQYDQTAHKVPLLRRPYI